MCGPQLPSWDANYAQGYQARGTSHDTQCAPTSNTFRQNILVFQERPALIVKVADFGLARVLNGNSVHQVCYIHSCSGRSTDFNANIRQSLCGTPIYMAPEVVMSGGAGSPHYGFKSDSWSFGVVIYAMYVLEYLECLLPYEYLTCVP